MKRIVSIAALSVATLVAASVVFADTTSSILPTAEGTYLQWTPKSGTVHYTQVDESTCNGTTDYNSTATVGNRDSYVVSLASIPDDATITSIAITPCASRNSSGGGSATMNVFYRFSGVNSADAGAYALTGTTPTALSATTFSSLSHVKGVSSTLEVGAVYSAGTKGARLGRIATVITYTPAAPVVTTNAASSLTTTTGTLNGAANPKGAAATGWFRYSTTNPGVCDDTFGTRLPSSGGTSLGAGTSSVAYAQGATGLTPGTTYYYCAIASSTSGTGFGNVTSFTTTLPPAPTVTTSAATSVSTSSATLNGSGNPGGWATTGWFRYSTTNPGTCDDTFGTRLPSSGGTSLGSGTTSVAYALGATGLSSGTTYYYCAIGNAVGGTGFGSVVSFTTTPTAPAAPSGLSATNVSGSQNNLAWTDNSSNEDGFTVERSMNNTSSFTHIATTSAGTSTYSSTGLFINQTYYYRVRAFNAGGYSNYSSTAYAITATAVPSVPTSVTATASSTTVTLAWTQSSTNEEGFKVERGTDGINFGEIAILGMNATGHTDPGLSSGTYYYRVRAYNTIGDSVYSTTTSAVVP